MCAPELLTCVPAQPRDATCCQWLPAKPLIGLVAPTGPCSGGVRLAFGEPRVRLGLSVRLQGAAGWEGGALSSTSGEQVAAAAPAHRTRVGLT